MSIIMLVVTVQIIIVMDGGRNDVIINPSDQPPCVIPQLQMVQYNVATISRNDMTTWISQYIPLHCMNGCVLIVKH